MSEFHDLDRDEPEDKPQETRGVEWKPVRWYQTIWHRPVWKEPTAEELEAFDKFWLEVWSK